MTSRKKKSIVRRILSLHEKGKALYAQADDLTQLLTAHVPVNEAIEVPAGRFAIVDNFKDCNVAFRQARVKRFELKKLAKMPTRPAPETEAALA